MKLFFNLPKYLTLEKNLTVPKVVELFRREQNKVDSDKLKIKNGEQFKPKKDKHETNLRILRLVTDYKNYFFIVSFVSLFFFQYAPFKLMNVVKKKKFTFKISGRRLNHSWPIEHIFVKKLFGRLNTVSSNKEPDAERRLANLVLFSVAVVRRIFCGENPLSWGKWTRLNF
ncbi:hypothetical protein BpHYR1_046377 [Brachionus plicatilis]|uniref:Uncharacterized protein n=1 Tax=Brachionus plicatilis TaxID=10195 RepID=A0A3M7PPF2_BRAPC|nr:hypothetical protein BpHYR1_046377 [Brachionus plicatilis]